MDADTGDLNESIEAIETLLPQTQCTRCGYPDCHAYAVAIAAGKAPINQCPPGGQAGIERLAALLNVTAEPLNPEFGVEGPRTTAFIDEQRCIGCTLCIQACPLDAIVGTAKRMHTVLTACCSGCDLCVAPCPVDCIDMVSLETLAANGYLEAKRILDHSIDDLAPVFRRRYAERQTRNRRQQEESERRLRNKAGIRARDMQRESKSAVNDKRADTIAAALERARTRRRVDT
ncbi:MAG: RnfABCDGE type electron transport complex subunit B [Betaproteobacteria bacterium]|jgi:electron transport complex protein RnfB|nr:MAG: RnfABCDGE type electron transport complex subunit B [Betaproteobacteria bacterium]